MKCFSTHHCLKTANEVQLILHPVFRNDHQRSKLHGMMRLPRMEPQMHCLALKSNCEGCQSNEAVEIQLFHLHFPNSNCPLHSFKTQIRKKTRHLNNACLFSHLSFKAAWAVRETMHGEKSFFLTPAPQKNTPSNIVTTVRDSIATLLGKITHWNS